MRKEQKHTLLESAFGKVPGLSAIDRKLERNVRRIEVGTLPGTNEVSFSFFIRQTGKFP